MKKNDFIDIKTLDRKSLLKKMSDFKKEIAELILDKNLNKLTNLKLINTRRRDLAQVLTVLRQKELLGEVSEPSFAKATVGKKGEK